MSDEEAGPSTGRRQIRKILGTSKLSIDTSDAAKREKERKERLQQRKIKVSCVFLGLK